MSARGAADVGWAYGAHVARYVSPLLILVVMLKGLGLF